MRKDNVRTPRTPIWIGDSTKASSWLISRGHSSRRLLSTGFHHECVEENDGYFTLSLWLIMITPALVGGSRIHSCSKEAALVGGSGVYGSSKEAVVMERGPVPSSSSSPCTHIGIGNGNDRPCPPHPLIHGDNDGWCPYYGLLLYEIIYFWSFWML